MISSLQTVWKHASNQLCILSQLYSNTLHCWFATTCRLCLCNDIIYCRSLCCQAPPAARGVRLLHPAMAHNVPVHCCTHDTCRRSAAVCWHLLRQPCLPSSTSCCM
jgi:hypothetical protein